MHFTYRTRGTCSQQILFDVDGKTVRNIEFIGGCNGNLQGISKLVEGMDIDTVIERLDGIHCGIRNPPAASVVTAVGITCSASVLSERRLPSRPIWKRPVHLAR